MIKVQKRILSLLLAVLLLGCASFLISQTAFAENDPAEAAESEPFPLEDGIYSVAFDTDGSMFHVNEICEGRAELFVLNGRAMLRLVMPSKNVLHLYRGTAQEAQEENAKVLNPRTETVVYPDGFEDSVYVFDVPDPVLDEEFDLALVGKKETWYDHKVRISDPERIAETEAVQVSLEGGTGKVTVESPAFLCHREDGDILILKWNSKFYDYMIVDGEKYEPVSVTEQSTFEIPVRNTDESLQVIADTVAMSVPHEIEYTLTLTLHSEA